jgi:hypothetical protein
MGPFGAGTGFPEHEPAPPPREGSSATATAHPLVTAFTFSVIMLKGNCHQHQNSLLYTHSNVSFPARTRYLNSLFLLFCLSPITHSKTATGPDPRHYQWGALYILSQEGTVTLTIKKPSLSKKTLRNYLI